MLEDYCNSLTDEAQLEIALRLCRISLPVWTGYFEENRQEITRINRLIGPGNRVKGGTKRIPADFIEIALNKIEKSYREACLISEHPVREMKKDPELFPLLSTALQPLTNQKWDDTLPYAVRLVFTSLWNILTWLIYRKMTDAEETHIYVAINQAVDSLLTEEILGIEEIESILLEYREEVRGEEEEIPGKENNQPGSETAEGEETEDEMDRVYKKIISPEYNTVTDPPTEEQKGEILRQMREEGKTFWDQWEEYYTGTCKIYSYNKEEKSFWRSESDVVAASFFNEYPMSEEEMRDFLTGISTRDLQEDDFNI